VESAGDAEVSRVIADPRALAYLASEALGRKAIAGVLHRPSRPVLDALQSASRDIAPEDRRALVSALAGRYRSMGDFRGCDTVGRALHDPSDREALLAEVLQSALDSEASARTLGPDDAAAVLVHAARQGVDGKLSLGLLRATARHITRCAAAGTVPDRHLAVMFSELLLEGGKGDSLAAAISLRPTMLENSVLEERHREHCLAFLAELDLERREAVLPALIPLFAQRGDSARLRRILRTLPDLAAGQCLAQACAATAGSPTSTPPGDLCYEYAGLVLERAGAGGRDSADLASMALELLAHSNLAEAERAAQCVRSLSLHTSPELSIEIARGASDSSRRDLRVGLAGLALQNAVRNARSPSDVAKVWKELSALNHNGTEAERLRQLLRYADDPHPGKPTATVLAWVARGLLSESPKLFTSIGRLRDEEADQYARLLAARTPPQFIKELSAYVESGARRSRAFWAALESHISRSGGRTPARAGGRGQSGPPRR